MEENRLDRIEKILENQAKHQEAITQSVELLASMQIKNEERMAHLETVVEKMTQYSKRMERIALKSAADFHMRITKLEEDEDAA
jgi:uncharacterized protein YaaN involved in tellurite resistance